MNDITSRASLQQVPRVRRGLVKADPSQITYVQLEDQSIIERNTGARAACWMRCARQR